MARKIHLTLNYAATAYIEGMNGKMHRLRHGDAPIEIPEKLYNEYKKCSCNVEVPISNKRINVMIPRYLFTITEEE